jgi:soluble lytic murein transglycosylase-like protein
LAAVAVVFLFCVSTASAAKIYVYERSDGSRLITDHRHLEAGYRLIKTYGVDNDGWATIRPQRSHRLRPIPSRFDPLIRNTASQFGVDAALVKAVVHVESGFDPRAVSPKGASGLMQLMPQTASRYGVHRIFDPRQNITGGVRYLRDLLSGFAGNTRLALAGYNAGENAVIRYNGVPPYPETRGYITRVMSLYQRYQVRR